jgi:hypothetical protein
MFRRNALSILFLFVPCLLLGQEIAGGQEVGNSLDIFGYFQTTFDHSAEKQSVMRMPEVTSTRNTFILQQANIFLRKQFDPKFAAFINVEFTNTFSTSRQWGTFRLEEAWARYEPSKLFSLKAGLLIPVFNNLNEIKNRMPLLPYITRPFVYEASAEGTAVVDETIPASAFVQAQGTVDLPHIKLEYAFYMGNSDPSFVTTNNGLGRYLIGGIDTTTYKLLGGRVGLRWEKLKAGFSFASDKVNRNGIGLGAVPRRRLGGDLSFQVGPVSLESEIVSTEEVLKDAQLQTFQTIARMNPLLGTELKNLFVYGLIMYDITEQFYAFTGAEYLQSHGNSLTRGYWLGGGYRPIEQAVVKLQYLHIQNTFGSMSTYQSDRVQVGVSVMF